MPSHDVTVESSGRMARVVCDEPGCGWAGDWHPTVAPTLSKRLRSDANGHFWAMRRDGETGESA